jgi:hypothetical protein
MSSTKNPRSQATKASDRTTTCLLCDGTGQICNCCGESEAYGCSCDEGFEDCPDCNGTGE